MPGEAALIEQKDAAAGVGEIVGGGTASRAGTDDEGVVVEEHRFQFSGWDQAVDSWFGRLSSRFDYAA